MSGTYHCTLCQKPFASPRGLSIHISKTHPDWEIQLQAPIRARGGLPREDVDDGVDDGVSSTRSSRSTIPNGVGDGDFDADDGAHLDVGISEDDDGLSEKSLYPLPLRMMLSLLAAVMNRMLFMNY